MNHLRYLYRGHDGQLLTRDFIMDIDRVMEWNDSMIAIQSQTISDRLLDFNDNRNIIFLVSKKFTFRHWNLNNGNNDYLYDIRDHGFGRMAFWNHYGEFCETGMYRKDIIRFIGGHCDSTFSYFNPDAGESGTYIGENVDFDMHLHPPYDGELRGFFNCDDNSLPVYCNEHDLFYHDSGTYYDEDNIPNHDDDDNDDDDNYDDHDNYGNVKYVAEYHSRRSEKVSDRRLNNGGFWIGFEIEKEDRDIRESITLSEFKSAFPQWRKERDGSLKSDSGFELISPILPLDIDYLSGLLKNSPILTRHINAKYSANCGGHINISDYNRSPDTLYDDIAGYFPILAALYPSRCSNTFSKLYGKIKMKEGSAGRSAFNLRSDRIELRIFPAVRNVDNLLFRARLIRYIMENPARYISDVNMDDIRALCDHIHDTETKRGAFQERIFEYDSMIFQETEI